MTFLGYIARLASTVSVARMHCYGRRAKLEIVHDAAPFLAWHRYFVHIYESALKDECGYTASMP